MNDKEETKRWESICKDAGIGKTSYFIDGKEIKNYQEDEGGCSWSSATGNTIMVGDPPVIVTKHIPPPYNATNREKIEECIVKEFPTLKLDFYEDGVNKDIWKLSASHSEKQVICAAHSYPLALLNLLLKLPEIYPELSKIEFDWS